MSPTSDQLRDHLLPEEPLRAASPATLADDSSRQEVSVGVTDRRLLCVSDDGTYVNVDFDGICTIRSEPRTSLTYHGNDYRLLVGAGGLVAVLGLVALFAFTSGALGPLLAVAAVGALAATAFLHRADDPAELVPADAIERRTASDFDAVETLRRFEDGLSERVSPERQVLAAGGLLVLGCLAGALALASTPFVVLSTVPIVGGLALADYGYRHRETFDGVELVRRRERAVRITTADGRRVTLTSDPATAIDRELSRLAFVDDADSAQVISARS